MTGVENFDFVTSAPRVQLGPQPPPVLEVPMRVEPQPAEVPKTVPHLDERTLQAFTREQDARVEQHRKMLDEEAECNAQRLREAVLQQEARVQELAGAHVAKQKEISAHEAQQSIYYVGQVAEQKLREVRSELIASETAAKQRLETIAQERDAARQSETRSLLDATRNEPVSYTHLTLPTNREV